MHCHGNILRIICIFVLILILCKDICLAGIIDHDAYNDDQNVNKRQWQQLSYENKEHINKESTDNSFINRGKSIMTYNKRAWEMMNSIWRKRQNGWNRRGAGNWNSLKQLWGKRNDP